MIQTAQPDWLIADILANCPEVPMSMVRRCITRAVREFSVAGMVCPTIDVPTQKNVANYPLDDLIPEGYRIKHIKRVEWCGSCINPIQPCTPCPTGYEIDDLHHITLHGGYVPCDDAQDDLRIAVTLDVTNDNCEIPQDLLDRHEPDLYIGAMAHIYAMKDRDWTDERMAKDMDEKFRGCIASAKCLKSQGYNDCNTYIAPYCMI